MSVFMTVWQQYEAISPFGCHGLLAFWIFYCTTSFCFWFFLDRHDRRDLRIQAHKKIANISDIFVNVCINLFIMSPIYGAVGDHLTGAKANWEMLSIPEFVFWFILQVISVDVIFYWTHRLCHVKPLYVRVHKRHHELHSPIAFSSVYAHWFEHIFVNVTSSFIFQYYVNNSYLLVFWASVAAFKTCQGHSGYDFSFIGKSWNYHDLHHENPKYNFGSGALMIFDRLFGTLKSREEIASLVRASEKARVANARAGVKAGANKAA